MRWRAVNVLLLQKVLSSLGERKHNLRQGWGIHGLTPTQMQSSVSLAEAHGRPMWMPIRAWWCTGTCKDTQKITTQHIGDKGFAIKIASLAEIEFRAAFDKLQDTAPHLHNTHALMFQFVSYTIVCNYCCYCFASFHPAPFIKSIVPSNSSW